MQSWFWTGLDCSKIWRLSATQFTPRGETRLNRSVKSSCVAAVWTGQLLWTCSVIRFSVAGSRKSSKIQLTRQQCNLTNLFCGVTSKQCELGFCPSQYQWTTQERSWTALSQQYHALLKCWLTNHQKWRVLFDSNTVYYMLSFTLNFLVTQWFLLETS